MVVRVSLCAVGVRPETTVRVRHERLLREHRPAAEGEERHAAEHLERRLPALGNGEARDRRDDGADGDDANDPGTDAAAVDVLVPSAFAVTLPRRDDGPAGRLSLHSFAALKHRAVIVIANGFTYRGLFVGADDDDVYLKGELRWWVLPLLSLTSVRIDTERDNDGGNNGDNNGGDNGGDNGGGPS